MSLLKKIRNSILLALHKGYTEDAIIRKCGEMEPMDNQGEKVIMFHGVSVGEINAIEKLVKTTREKFPKIKIVVTTGTNTGQENAIKKLCGTADLITYFPFDNPISVKKFLQNINPTAVFIAETEIWPIFVSMCKNVYIINGRISDRTYNSYKKLKFFFKPLLNKYAGIYTQSTEDLDKFLSLGSNPNTTKRMNNLKFDITVPNVDISLEHEGRIFLCASTHSGEDDIAVNTYTELKEKYPDLKLIIAPRHLTRLQEVESCVKKSNLSYGFRSRYENLISNDILILDTMGELGKMFAFCDFAFIGGSFNKTGGHNPLESIIFSKPVVSGPSIHNFKDIYSIITNARAGFVVKSQNELYKISDKLLSDAGFYANTQNACAQVFKDQQGALDFVLNVIDSIITAK